MRLTLCDAAALQRTQSLTYALQRVIPVVLHGGGQDWFRATLIAGFDGTLRKNANEFLQQALVRFHGQPLRLPQRFAPELNLLRQHREARFMG